MQLPWILAAFLVGAALSGPCAIEEHTDAAKVAEADLDTCDYAGFVPAAEQAKVSEAARS